jgi:hypothetical protein
MKSVGAGAGILATGVGFAAGNATGAAVVVGAGGGGTSAAGGGGGASVVCAGGGTSGLGGGGASVGGGGGGVSVVVGAGGGVCEYCKIEKTQRRMRESESRELTSTTTGAEEDVEMVVGFW